MGSSDFGNLIKGIWQLFLKFIDFLFDTDFKEENETENPFSNIPDSAIPINNKNKVVLSEDQELIESAFGKDAAKYINKLRDEVDYLLKEHNLEKMDSIFTMIPPAQLVSASAINNIIENIYMQFDGDVILRPGKINVFTSDAGIKFAEFYIDCYKPFDELVKN